ncbi:ABC transporter ATP-binding protein [Candidatus Sumerlaeota bacterium]|nr:ABC transporter ATP-binding protein [Candidatus Sumerlaeota bacterium]
MAPVIEIRNLSKIYVQNFIDVEHGRLKIRLKNRRTAALQDLTLDVEEGEIFGLLGPNGAGKTTTIKILMGIHFATRGTAKIMGHPLGHKPTKAKIGFLPENPYFYDYLTGREFLHYYGQLYGMERSLRRKRTEELLELTGIAYAADVPLKGYSKGMLQRAGLAQALLNDPKIVFLDEPQSGLDPLGRKEVRDLILLLRDQGKTVFFSSHILSDAELICDRVAIVHKGKLSSIGRLNELLSARIKEYEVTVAGISSETVEQFESQATRNVAAGEEHLFVFEGEQAAQALVRKCLAENGRLISLAPRKETLEEFFVDQVRPSGEETKAKNI